MKLRAVEKQLERSNEWIIFDRIGLERWDWLKDKDNLDGKWGDDYMNKELQQDLIKW